MPAGLTVLNDNGVYQIDETTYNLSILQSGSYNSLSGGMIQTTVPDPVFAAYIPQSSGTWGGIGSITNNGAGTTSAEIRLFYGQFDTPDFTNIKWFVLGRPTVSASGSGMEVYDGSGNLKFSTAWPVARIDGWAGYVNNPGRRYAIIGGDVSTETTYDFSQYTNSVWMMRVTTFANGYYAANGQLIEQNSVIFESLTEGGGGSSYVETFGNLAPPLALDVTEYTV